MGGAIAARMINSGVQLLAYDTDKEVLARMKARGASVTSSVRDVADHCEIIFACLPTADVCRAVALGPDGVAQGTKVKIYADLSTMGGATAIDLSSNLAKRNITFLDSPVVGGVINLDSDTLGVLVAGPIAAVERVKPYYEAFAGRIFYLGEEPGIAQVGKVVNNAVGYAALYATFEAVAVGMKAGIDMRTCVDIINHGSGANFYTQKIFPTYIIPGKFTGTGAVEIGVKDVKCFLEEAKRLNADTPAARANSALGIRAAAAGPAGRDTLTLFHYFCDLVGVPRRV
jgi:3-hydroxyisobutyrate dehydrogenase-like beta-hydroxyacid dehydrogenase